MWLLFPGILLILSFLLPDDAINAFWNVLSNLIEDIPFVGTLFDLVQSFRSVAGSDNNYLLFMNNLIENIGNCIIEVTIEGMCIFAMIQLNRICKLRGVPAIAIMLGAVIGVIVLGVTRPLPTPFKIAIIIIMIIGNIVLLVLANPRKPFHSYIGSLIAMGFQAVVAAYTQFFIACILKIFAERITGFNDLLVLWIIPALVMTAMLIFDNVIT